jgi:hypothetical protein
MGGGLFNGGLGTLTLTDCTLAANSAFNGGGLDNGHTATLTDCTLAANSAANSGGGLINVGTATLTECTVSGNSAASVGGGLGNIGTATLTDTIVAGNTGGGASDVSGSVSGTYNLFGTGGSGGLTNDTNNNIVLSDLANLGLAPLGHYGGPTQTMALLPGSTAIGQGIGQGGITSDQRGASRATSGATDIGAFQDQGYTLAVASGSPQHTVVSQAFANPLVAVLTESFASSPLPGVAIGFSAPSSGASATLVSSPATTDASGQASVTATANATGGAYTVTASASGVASPASFNLTNQIPVILTGSRVYDGTTTAGVSVLSVANEVSGDDLTLSGSVTLAGKDAGSEAITSFADLSLGGTSVGDYTLTGASGTVTVNPLAVTLSGSRVYDGTTAAAAGILTVVNAIEGDAVDVASGTATLASKDAGSRAITDLGTLTLGNNAAADYTLTGATGMVTLTPRAITVIAATNTKTYDGTTAASAVPTITAGGLAPGDTASFTESYRGKDAGTGLTLTASGTVHDGNGGADYSVTFQAASGAITPAPLTITADSVSIPFGAALPPLTASYAGFVHGETAAVLTTPVHLGTPATSNYQPGAYAIIASSASSPDYVITFVNGTLTAAPPVPPTQPRARAMDGFLTTLYSEILGRGPDSLG